MSRYDKQLRKSIQRIVLDSPALTNALDAYANRGGFGAAVGSAASDAEESRLCCDGSTGAPNPGTSARDPDASSQDGLDPNDPANLGDMGEGSLTGLTDCATGEPVCMDGAGFIPPDGWDSPSEPPDDPEWVPSSDEFWLSGDQEHYTRTKGQMRDYISGLDDFIAFTTDTDDQLCADYRFYTGSGSYIGTYCGDRYDCPSVLDSGYCGTEKGFPENTYSPNAAWPSDGCTNLAIVNGTIVGSKYDPENDGSYSVPRDSIDLCDGSGNQISLSPSADGGWKTIDAINGGDGYLYDSSGTQIARISEAEYSDPNV